MPSVPYLFWLVMTPTVLVSAAFWSAVCLAAYRPLVRRCGLRPVPTALALASFGLIAVITFTASPGADPLTGSSHGCLAVTRTQLTEAVTHFGRGVQEQLNILMLVPLGFFATLATRRPWWCVLGAAVLPAVIESVQSGLAGRVCSPLDWTDNTAGGLLGIAVAAMWAHAARRRTA